MVLFRSCFRVVFVIAFFFLSDDARAQTFKLPTLDSFISDTLHIEVPIDSSLNPALSHIQVIDSRELKGSLLGIRQTKKYKYIPVDQYLSLNQSMSDLFQRQFLQDSLQRSGQLQLSHLILWWDGSPVLDKGLVMSAYTTYHDSLDRPISDWIWEIRLKKEKKEEEAAYLSRFVQKFLRQQSQAIQKGSYHPNFYPYLFRRQLMTWSEFIFFKDGYGVNVHFTLDFPPDQKSHWKRGSPGLFYRRSKIHESISIGGKDQKWFWRVSPRWVAESSATFRFGFNNFERGQFDHLSYWNVLYVNISGQVGLNYRPVYHRGVFGGLGLYGGYSVLPDVIPQEELGVFLRLGVVLP